MKKMTRWQFHNITLWSSDPQTQKKQHDGRTQKDRRRLKEKTELIKTSYYYTPTPRKIKFYLSHRSKGKRGSGFEAGCNCWKRDVASSLFFLFFSTALLLFVDVSLKKHKSTGGVCAVCACVRACVSPHQNPSADINPALQSGGFAPEVSATGRFKRQKFCFRTTIKPKCHFHQAARWRLTVCPPRLAS